MQLGGRRMNIFDFLLSVSSLVRLPFEEFRSWRASFQSAPPEHSRRSPGRNRQHRHLKPHEAKCRWGRELTVRRQLRSGKTLGCMDTVSARMRQQGAPASVFISMRQHESARTSDHLSWPFNLIHSLPHRPGEYGLVGSLAMMPS